MTISNLAGGFNHINPILHHRPSTDVRVTVTIIGCAQTQEPDQGLALGIERWMGPSDVCCHVFIENCLSFLSSVLYLHHHSITPNPYINLWLVVSTPLKNMKVSEECEDYYSQDMESHKKHVPNHQPDSLSHDIPMILDTSAALGGLRSFQG